MNNDHKVRVIIADDHALFREGLKRILEMEDQLEVISECGDGSEVLECCKKHKPDVLLLDINMPNENGVITTEKVTQHFPFVKIVILSIHDDESYVFETLKKGASGYLLKDMESNELIHAINSVVKGYSYIHPKVSGKLINHLRRMTYLNETGIAKPQEQQSKVTSNVRYIYDLENPLTKREAEVLCLMAEGRNNKAIGEQLFISEKTVKNHVSSILQKLEVEDRTQAVINSIKKGWVTL
ncbi:response regulator transcription factor [Chengkuizengella sediminis]|uniref:response regulator transcription factor n=1 Tax=Chengkuizengella sediminis TaxID=1885917 RepID=UPI00138A597E|nr:response regulator transcription factor [Chengkuizengella sediminis]NDI36530.1 response regulator transcription factor [Chengkuizengella sediminis]